MKIRINAQLAGMAALALLALVPYLQTFHFDFVLYDDNEYLFQNAMVGQGVSWQGLQWAFAPGGHVANWHPLTWLSLMADVSLFGMNPGASHAVNALIHALNAVLLFVLLRRLTGHSGAAFLAAAIWAVHPLRVESVAWLSQRKDVLSVFFGLLAMLAFVRSLRPVVAAQKAAGSPGRATQPAPAADEWLVLSAACFALAFMAKPSVVTFPVLAALLQFAVIGQVRWRDLQLLFWLAIAGALVTIFVQDLGGAMSDVSAVPIGFRIPNAVASLGVYVQQSLLPTHLAVFYPLARPIPWQHLLSGVLAGLAAVALFWFAGFSRPTRAVGPAKLSGGNLLSLLPYAAGIGWFIAGLAPVIGIIQVGAQAHADRYTYWPSIGLAMGMAWGLAQLFAFRPRWHAEAWILGMGAVLALTTASTRQATVWRNTGTLFTHAISVTSRNAVAHGNLGIYLCMQGQRIEGLRQLKLAALAEPGTDQLALLALGLSEANELDNAAKLADQVRQRDPKEFKAWLTLASVAYRRKSYAEAERLFRQTLVLKPELDSAWNGYGNAFARQQKWPEAIAAWRRALELNPWLGASRENLQIHSKRVTGRRLPDWKNLLADPAEQLGL